MQTLPAVLPDDPLPLAQRWLADAARAAGQRNPGAMALATATPSGRPSVRMVLLKRLTADDGFAVFYTNRDSRKGGELEGNPWAAGTLYWEQLGRQLRLEGLVARASDEESDAYFATRPRGSQLNAWASAQSRPIAELGELERRADEKSLEFGADAPIPRPPFWGGYRIWLDSVEFWVEGRDRFHERVRYQRSLTPGPDARTVVVDRGWHHVRLQP
jgi:pyridoxamine 5'-phosphate oxidase